jgi:excisionase family DNA binding protein
VRGALTITLPPDAAEAIAQRAAAIVLERLSAEPRIAEYLTVSEAAEYLRSKPQRIYDLLSARRLTRHKDGRRVLVSRVELDTYLAEGGSRPIAPTLPPIPQTRTTTGVRA